MTNYREILRLHSLGLNKTEIASSCRCARNTVAATLQRAANCGLQWPLPEEMSDKQLSERLFPSSTSTPVYKMPDYDYVHKELQRSGVTLNLLWLEYCDQCRAAGEIPYQSTQFNKYYADYLTKVNATMHLNHKPGEVMQVDWAGDTAAVIDTDTGEIIPAYVFVATLPYSGYSYVEAFFSMNQEAWSTAHVNAYKYFGGVTRIIQCDNLKTGVQKHGKDEVVLNKSYQELAEHYGTAILPARVRAPKDKAAVEGTVGIISTFILAALRNRQFLSLLELNEAIWDRLETFNHKPFQKREGSRASSFAEERPFLRPLPPRPFELATWKVATIGPNYHISVERMNYSVPFEYIKQKVDVRLTRATVEVFYGGNRICSHPRLYGRFNQYSTIQEHMPPEHQKYVQWNGERFIHWAGKAGSNTQVAVQVILSSYKVEQQGYKSCMGLLKLADKYTPERLENACKRALEYTPRPSLKNIQAILASGQDKAIPEQSTATASSAQYGFTRGAAYYGRGEQVMLTETTVSKLREMRLSVMANALKDQLADPQFQSMAFEDRLGLLVDAEWNARKNNHLNKLIRQATFSDPGACLENVEYLPDRGLKQEELFRFGTCNYIQEHHNIILLGATGSGKTYLACALGMAAARQFYAAKYIRLPDLLVEFQIARGNGTIRKLMAQYRKYALLIIDEWLLYPLKETEARDLLEIVESRYKRNSTIFCSQFDIPGWPEKLSDLLLADAICNRIVHDAYTIVIGGKESMRKRKGLQDI